MPKSIREELVIFCKENNIDIFFISRIYSLDNEATDEQFKKALNFCQLWASLKKIKEAKYE